MTQAPMRMRTRCERLGIRATATLVESNPNLDAKEWPAGATHWKVTLFRGGMGTRRRLTVYFSMGSAHMREPEAADVLDCLASDATGYENARSFEEWCGEYGYDTDSRKAERTYRLIGRQVEQLRRFLGDDFDAVLYHTERL